MAVKRRFKVTASAGDIAELHSGKASARDRAEARAGRKKKRRRKR